MDRACLADVGLASYKIGMRRSTRLGLAFLAALAVIFGAYTAYWFVAAARIEDGVVAWAQSARAEKLDVFWQAIRVSGFPLVFRVELETASLRDDAITPSPQFGVASLFGTARPWNFAIWRLTAPAGFSGELVGAGGRVPLKLAARIADGVVSLEPESGWKLWLAMQSAGIEAADRVQVGSADAWVVVPPKPPSERTDPKTVLAVDAREVRLPVSIEPLGDRIDDLDFGVTVKGVIPGGKLSQAMAVWRDSGGTIELDNLRLRWGALGATATGTMALDQELQPIGGFSGAIQGYDDILTALVESGRLRATDAGLARIALTMLAKAGSDGRPEIKTAFTIQNGQMFLGPAKLGKAPHLNWE